MVHKKSITLIYIFIFSVFVFYACNEEDDITLGEVSISLSNSFPAQGEVITIKLHNMPKKIKDLHFDFGDGTESSEALNYKSYEKDGTYKIKASFINDSGKEVIRESSLKVEGTGLTNKLKELKQNNKIWVMAHRGTTANKTIPENSIAAIQSCIKAGVDVVEIDTYVTKDGQIVVCHDPTINRTTTGSGKIADLSLNQIRQFKLRDLNGNPTNAVMPTLKEALLAGRGKILYNIDYSPRDASTTGVFNIVNECGMIDRCFFYTGNKPAYVNELIQLSLNAHAYPWGGSLINYEQLLNYPRPFFLQFDFSQVGENSMIDATKRGMLVSVNILDSDFENTFISGHFSQMDNLISGGVRMIQTDICENVISYLRIKGYR